MLLDHPAVWETSRMALDLSFGLYRKRRRLLREWSLLEGQPSLLDIGCGIGQYSTLTNGRYLGVDRDCRYVEYARSRRAGENRRFECADASDLEQESERFDLVLMVDFLHHLDEAACATVLRTAATLSRRHVAVLEPVREQPNPVGRWFIEHDRGDHMRTLDEVHGLLDAAPLRRDRSARLLLGPIETRAILCTPTETETTGASA